MKKTDKDYDYTVPVIVVIGLFVLTLMLNVAVMPKRVMSTQSVPPSPSMYEGREHLFIIDQKVSDRIVILSAALKQNGFVVITNEKTGRIVAESRLLRSGLYSNKAVLLSASVVPGDELFATIYTDNGDGKFDPNTIDDVMESVMTWFTVLK